LIPFETKLIHFLEWKACHITRPSIEKYRFGAFLRYNDSCANLATIRRKEAKYHKSALAVTLLGRACVMELRAVHFETITKKAMA